MTVLSDLRTYLGDSTEVGDGTTQQWSDAELTSCIDAETASQARKIKVGLAVSPLTADLYEALLRRCARNLALRKAPMGIAISTGGDEATRVSGKDPEVTRLEAPYRRLVVG